MILNCVSSIKQSWRPSDFLAPCDCIILHHRPHRCGLLPVLSTSLYQKHPPARDLLRLEKGMLHQGGCVRARALSAWPWLARLSAGRPGAPLFSLHAFSWDPRALACICVSDLFLSRCEGQGLGVSCLEAVPRVFVSNSCCVL